MYNRDNFYKNTRCVFTLRQRCFGSQDPDYVSDSGSRYWFTDEGVYRIADHWGHVGNECYWKLVQGWDRCPPEAKKLHTGFAYWADFEPYMEPKTIKKELMQVVLKLHCAMRDNDPELVREAKERLEFIVYSTGELTAEKSPLTELIKKKGKL